jgi:hypothetical protein
LEQTRGKTVHSDHVNVFVWSLSLLIVSMVTLCMYPLYYLNTRVNTMLYTRPGKCTSRELVFLSSLVTIDAKNDVFYMQRFYGQKIINRCSEGSYWRVHFKFSIIGCLMKSTRLI